MGSGQVKATPVVLALVLLSLVNLVVSVITEEWWLLAVAGGGIAIAAALWRGEKRVE